MAIVKISGLKLTVNTACATYTYPESKVQPPANASGGWEPLGIRLRFMSSQEVAQEVTEADLLKQVAAGDESAFDQLYTRLAPILFQLAFRILHDAALSEDVVQEAFLQIWDKAGHYDPKFGKPLSWAATLTRNKAIDRLRAGDRCHRITEEVGLDQQARQEDSIAPDSPTQAQETAHAVRLAISRLPAEQRQVIELAFFDGLTQTQIAGRLQIPLGTIKARIRRGLLQLRGALVDFL